MLIRGTGRRSATLPDGRPCSRGHTRVAAPRPAPTSLRNGTPFRYILERGAVLLPTLSRSGAASGADSPFRYGLATTGPAAMLARMPSLDSLVATHRTVLLIDSALTRIQVGLWQRDGDPIWSVSDQEAGIAIFACADRVLAQARIEITGIGALAFCEGPGSILGIRTTAMALRVWSVAAGRTLPAFAYRSLELVAVDLQRSGAPAPFAVVADARRDSWHWVDGPAGGPAGRLRRVPPQELLAFPGGIYTPAGFRAWTQPPRPISAVDYTLPDLWLRERTADLLEAAPQPDAFLHEEASYVTWTPQIHRAGTSPAQTKNES